MMIKLTSVTVDDQAKALAFYGGVLGFRTMQDIPMGEHRWLTVAGAEGPDDILLLLEPTAFPPAKVYQQALYGAGIPCAMFAVRDVTAEHQRLTRVGVVFRGPPNTAGPGPATATFDDTCGNLIRIFQVPA